MPCPASPEPKTAICLKIKMLTPECPQPAVTLCLVFQRRRSLLLLFILNGTNSGLIFPKQKYNYPTQEMISLQSAPQRGDRHHHHHHWLLILFMSEMKTSGYLAALQRGIPFISLTNATMGDDFQFSISKEIFLTIWSFIYISSLTTTSLRKIIISSFRF